MNYNLKQVDTTVLFRVTAVTTLVLVLRFVIREHRQSIHNLQLIN